MQDTDAFAVFDFKWTAEALANIVDNAIKYTEHGTIRISAVSYEMFARIDISDTVQAYRKLSKRRYLLAFTAQRRFRSRKGSASAYTLPDRSYPAREVISRCFRSGKRKYVFHISAEITTILSKLLDFISAGKNVERFLCDNLYVSKDDSFHTYRFFHGGTHLWKFYRQKT